MGRGGERSNAEVVGRERRRRPHDSSTESPVIARLVGDLDRVPTHQRRAAVVALAPHIGNRRVAQAIAGPPVVQRRGPFGMRKADQVGGFAGDVDAFARDNPTVTLADLCGFMMGKVNARLALNGVPRLPVPDLNSMRSAGGFSASSWTVQFDVDLLATKPLTATVADVPPERLNELAGVFYHEGRHAEQAFLVARFVAGKPGGPKDAKELSAVLDLHEPTAAAALRATTPMPTDRAALETIAGWRAYAKGGKHHDYREWNENLQTFVRNTSKSIPDPRPAGVGSIRTQMTTLARTFADWRNSTMPFADTKLASIRAVRRPDATDVQVRTDLTNTRRHLRKVMDAEAETNRELRKVDARLRQRKRMTTHEAEVFRLTVDAALAWRLRSPGSLSPRRRPTGPTPTRPMPTRRSGQSRRRWRRSRRRSPSIPDGRAPSRRTLHTSTQDPHSGPRSTAARRVRRRGPRALQR